MIIHLLKLNKTPRLTN